MRKIGQGISNGGDDPLTPVEAAELLEYHTVRASEAARVCDYPSAMAHGQAAQAIAAYLQLAFPMRSVET